MRDLRKACHGEIFDYGLLMSVLSSLKAPHRKITSLLKSGEIIRVKKGIYVFGEYHRQTPVHLGLLANLIYGPSYVSEEYALSWHGLIPERVDMVTNMTTGRKKIFNTPLGIFKYTYINSERFTVGIDWQELDNKFHFLLASPEKALVDTIASTPEIGDMNSMRIHLIENLRIDEDFLKNVNMERLRKITLVYHKPIVKLLCKTLEKGV